MLPDSNALRRSITRFPHLLTLFAMLLVTLATCAGAQTVTQTQIVTVPSTSLSGPYQTNLPITKFDPTLGTLQSITITLQGDIVSAMKIEVIDTQGHNVSATASGMLTLARPNTSSLITLNPTATAGPVFLQPFVQGLPNGGFTGDLVVDYGGTSGHNFGQITANTSSSTALGLPGDLALFTGSGSILLPFSAQASSSFSGIAGLAPWNGNPWLGAPGVPGGVNLRSVAQVITSSTDAKVTVVYTYTPFVTISGAVYVDWNENNQVDGNDAGKGGVPLQLLDSNGNPVLDSHGNPVTTTTDSNGNYSFGSLPPGTYIVQETVPSGFKPAGASTTSLTVNATNSVTNANFYIVCQKSSVYGRVWLDINANGVQDPGEPGLAGVTVSITEEDGEPCLCLDGGPVPDAVTGPDGSYSFVGICVGDDHVVKVNGVPAGVVPSFDPDGTLDNKTTIDVTPTPVLNVDFGYKGTGSISGTIFNDVNGNGVRDLPGDAGIPAGVVTLTWAGPNGLLGDGDDVVYPSVPTDSAGGYKFNDLPPGNFKVTVDPNSLPSNTSPTYDLDGIGTPNTAQVTLSVMGTTVTPVDNVDFGYTTKSTLSGFAYVDANNNGIFDGGDTPIEGVKVTLSGTTNLGSPIGPLIVTTDSTGAYGFGNLLPGTYTLTETQPAGYFDGKDTQGTPGTGTTANDQFTNIALSSGVSGISNNFGELQPASLSGYVYVDANNDGVKQGTEGGISSVTVTLTGTDDLGNAVNQSTTTGSDGSYAFNNLRPGTYTLTETPPSGYLDGTVAQGTPGTGTVGKDVISNITLNSGINGTENDFGNLSPSSLSGYVYVDANNDGVKQGTEGGISNVTVTLTGTDDLGNAVNQSTTTGNDGSYSFSNLRPGNYKITETQPSGNLDGKDTIGTPGGTAANDQFSGIVLGSGVSGTNNNFGELQSSSLSGYVYVDTNNDGVKQGTEAGISGVTVTLSGTDDLGNSVNKTTTTGNDGSYSFTNLRPGTYTLTETQPAGYNDGKDTIGTPGGTTGNDQFSGIVLNSGVNGANNNFGDLTPPVAKTGATRTWGFWKTHLAIMKLALPGINLGVLTCTSAQGGGTQDLTAPTIGQVESIFWTSPGKSTTSVGQSRLQLAHQLIAALANVNYIGTTTAQNGYAATLITDAVAALDGTDTSKMDDLASKLDSFNTSGDALDLPNGLSEGKADSKGAQALAGDPGKAFK